MQSQPNHIEILVEKNTVGNIVEDVAAEFGIPLTSGRGFASLPPREDMRDRFRNSGKEQLIIILVSDFDPSGEWISTSFARSMRDDFNLEVHPIKAALTFAQVTTMPDLPKSVDTGEKATADNAHYKAFKGKYGPVEDQGWYELEALAPNVLHRHCAQDHRQRDRPQSIQRRSAQAAAGGHRPGRPAQDHYRSVEDRQTGESGLVLIPGIKPGRRRVMPAALEGENETQITGADPEDRKKVDHRTESTDRRPDPG